MRTPAYLAPPLTAILLVMTLAGCSIGVPLAPSSISNVAEVNRLCAKDGGMHIYEVVPMSKPFKLVERKTLANGRELIYESEDEAYRHSSITLELLGAAGNGITKRYERFWRTSDGKLLGEYTSYATSGGEPTVPGFWTHGCSVFRNKYPGGVFMRALQGVKENW